MENPVGFSFTPQLTTKHTPTKNHSVMRQSPRVKRKRSPDDVDMDSARQNSQAPSGKRTRNLPIGRPLPLSRLLDDLDKAGLQDLLKSLCERHPGLSNEVYKHAPKPSVSRALSTLDKLERAVQQAFPFGDNVQGEYAYLRVLPAIKELLDALTDYVPHFLPPHEEHTADTLAFLDGATGFIARLPDWHNENHSLMKREAFEEIAGAWIQAFKEAGKKGAGLGAAAYVQKLRQWNDISQGLLDSAVLCANEELAFVSTERCAAVEQSPLRMHPLQGLFSQQA